jgi:Zinc carboxypeptidase
MLSSFLGLFLSTMIAGSSTASPPRRVTRRRSCFHGPRCVFPHYIEPFFSRFLQLREWDLWQMTHSYVDVYFPRRAIAEAELGLLPFRLPPGTSHRMEQVKRTSSCSCTHDLRAEHAPPCSHITASEAGTRWDVVSPSNATFHTQYHPLDEIQSFMRDLAAAYPKQVTIVPLGHSGEGREMFALEISALSDLAGASGAQASAGHGSHDQNPQVVFDGKGKERGTNPRCGFLITGAQHAREVSLRLFVCLV